MSTALIAFLRQWWPWLLLGLAVLIALSVGGWLWWRRAKTAPERPRSLLAVWKKQIGGVDRPERPMVLLLGPSMSGKSALVDGRWPGDRESGPRPPQDPRMQLRVRDEGLVLELSSEVMDDQTRKGVRERERLLRAIAWQVSAVALVVDLDAAGSTPDGLLRLGRRMGETLAPLKRRGSKIQLRVCVTHLDLSQPGFDEWMTELQKLSGVPLVLKIQPRGTASEALDASLEPLKPYWFVGLRTPAFDRVLQLAASARPRLLEPLKPLLNGLTPEGSPFDLDAVCFAALPPSANGKLLGDPFAWPEAGKNEFTARRDAERWRSRGYFALAVCGVLGVVSVPRWFAKRREGRVDAAVEALRAETRSVPPPAARRYSSAVEESALEAGQALHARAYPWMQRERQTSRQSYREAIRAYYLVPAARSTALDTRVAALSVMSAWKGDPMLGDLVSQVPALAARTGIRDEVLRDYLREAPSERSGAPLSERLAPLDVVTLGDLRAFFRRLRDTELSVLPWAGVPELREEARRLRNQVASSSPDRLTVRWIAGLTNHGYDVQSWLGPSSARDAASLEPILRVIDVVAETTTETSSAASSPAGEVLSDVVAALDRIARENVARPSTPERVEVSGETFVFDNARWLEGVTASRSTRRVSAWLASLGSVPRSSAFIPPRACLGAVGAVVPNGRVPSEVLRCEYTRDTDRVWVRAPLAALNDSLDRAKVAPLVRDQLRIELAARDRQYTAERRVELFAYYRNGYSFSCPPPDALGSDVQAMLGSESALTTFLMNFALNANVPGEPVADDFRVLTALGTPDATGRLLLLDGYSAVWRPVLPQLSSVRPLVVPPAAPLAARLSPIGVLGLAMLQGGDASPRVKITQWLDAQRVREDFRAPFMAPINCALRRGVEDVERVVADAWRQEFSPPLGELWSRFPFDPGAGLDASAAEVIALLSPHGGTFWALFDAVLAPVMTSSASGLLVPRATPLGRNLALPQGAIREIMRAQQLRDGLFSADGRPRAIALSVRPEPLPRDVQGAVPVMASLQVGAETVLAFNQSPVWQTVNVAWGEEVAASVMLRTSATSGGAERYQSIEREPGAWSFFHLLYAAGVAYSSGASARMTWMVPASGGVLFPVSFISRNDPWAPVVSYFGGRAR